MKYYFLQILNSFTNIPLFTQLGALFLVIMAPYAILAHILILFWSIDLITGIWKSSKEVMKGKKGFTNKLKIFWSNLQSKKLRWSVEKLACYLIVIMLMAIFEFYFFPISIAGYTITKLVAGFLSLIEIKSIFENLTLITGSQLFNNIFKIFKKQVEDKTGIDVSEDKK